MPTPQNVQTHSNNSLVTACPVMPSWKAMFSWKLQEEALGNFVITQSAFTCLKLTIEALGQDVKYVQSQLWTYFIPCSSVSIINFEHVITGWVPEVIGGSSDKNSKNLKKETAIVARHGQIKLSLPKLIVIATQSFSVLCKLN